MSRHFPIFIIAPILLAAGCTGAHRIPRLVYIGWDWNTYARPNLVVEQYSHDSSSPASIQMFRWRHGPGSNIPGPSQYLQETSSLTPMAPQSQLYGKPAPNEATRTPDLSTPQDNTMGTDSPAPTATTPSRPIEIDIPPELAPPAAPKTQEPAESGTPETMPAPLDWDLEGPTAGTWRRNSVPVSPVSAQSSTISKSRLVFGSRN
ncbi:MAG: hypothetical protein KDA78_02270 [Planctomycetaceae bacterium]|nr:hypothetical protein [Planctomycetaceae bacterium]